MGALWRGRERAVRALNPQAFHLCLPYVAQASLELFIFFFNFFL